MKAKTIKSVLRRNLSAWTSAIDDEKVRAAVEAGTIVTGGCIASMLLREDVNDYDVYFKDRATTLLVAKYYLKKFAENPPTRFKGSPSNTVEIYLADGYGHVIDENHKPNDEKSQRIKIVVKSAGAASEAGATDYGYFEMNPDGNAAADYVEAVAASAEAAKEDKSKPPFRPVFLTTNAITLSDDVQIVVRFFGEPDQIHENYDFVHCTNYWTSWDGALVLRPDALESLLAKELRYVGSKYPLCSIIRTRKFIQRQWTINAGQYLKMAMQLQDLDLNKVDVLEDQLTGVDAAYFLEVITALKERDSDRVDRTYLMQLIDKIF